MRKEFLQYVSLIYLRRIIDSDNSSPILLLKAKDINLEDNLIMCGGKKIHINDNNLCMLLQKLLAYYIETPNEYLFLR